MESASFKLPAVNIGIRQQGRERGKNVLDCPADRMRIGLALRQALSPDFRSSLHNLVNPYGDGHAAEKIAQVLSNSHLSESLLVKLPAPIHSYQPA
jgi:UDP-N-acetylglucosamine 2-epimerase